jgi:hypothetical protein
MTVHIEDEGHGSCLTIHVVGAVSAAAAGLGQIANPEGRTCIITRATWYTVVASTGAANLSVGCTTTGLAATDILNAMDAVAATAGTFWNGFVMQNGAKTNIAAPAIWHATDYVTFTGSASTVGLEGYLYLEYIAI